MLYEITNCQALTVSHAEGPVRLACHRLLAIVESYICEEYAPRKFHHSFKFKACIKNTSYGEWKRLHTIEEEDKKE